MPFHKDKTATGKDNPLNNYYPYSIDMRLELEVRYSTRCGRENLTTV